MAYLFYQHIIIICTVYAKFENDIRFILCRRPPMREGGAPYSKFAW